MPRGVRLTTEEATAIVLATGWMPAPGWVYGGVAKKIPGTCQRCGWESGPDGGPMMMSLRRGQGACWSCGKRAGGGSRVPIEETRAALDAAGWTPAAGWVYTNVYTPVPGTCQRCGWESGPDRGPRISQLRVGKGACFRCGQRSSASVNRLTIEEALAALDAAAWTPALGWVYTGSATPVPGTCQRCGWTSDKGPRIVALRRGGGACWRCAQGALIHDEALAICRERGWTPREGWVYEGVGKRIPGSCDECGRDGSGPTLGNLKAGNGACVNCAAMRKGINRREGRAEEARRRMLAAGAMPKGEYPGAAKPWPATCMKCGADIAPRVNNLGKSGACGNCAESGFDVTAPARLYIICHPEYGAAKVGVTTAANDHRLDKFRREGWQVVSTRTFATGGEAMAEERRMLRTLRKAGYPPHLTAEQMPMGGATETFSIHALGEGSHPRRFLHDGRPSEVGHVDNIAHTIEQAQHGAGP